MNEELLKSLISLFAVITNADGKLDEAEIVYFNSFVEDYLGKDLAVKYRRLFIKYFNYTHKAQVSEEHIQEICTRINLNLEKKQKLMAIVRLLEISVFNSDYEGLKRLMIKSISEYLNIDENIFFLVENFVYSRHLKDLLDHESFLVYSSMDVKFDSIKTKKVDGLGKNQVWFLHIDEYDFYLVKIIGQEVEASLNFIPAKPGLIYQFSSGANLKLSKELNLYYSDVAIEFLDIPYQEKFVLNAENLQLSFDESDSGLKDITLSEEAGHLVAIMGGSGSGKTTLINVLSGLQKPNEGHVFINDVDIYSKEGKQKVVGLIGYVPQDDVLIEELTVYENLFYNTQLCFGNLSEVEVDSMVNKTLSELGILGIKDLRVGNFLNKRISGGQRKRLNIALELIRSPSILFLDEPTSGLSSRDSANVMDFLKQLTNKGNLVITVIHQPSSDIYNLFDKVVILDSGGRQIYYGNPREAIIYFKSNSQNLVHQRVKSIEAYSNPEEIFNIVEEELVDEHGNSNGIRKFSPQYWGQLFKNIQLDIKPKLQGLQSTITKLPSRLKQFQVYFSRDLKAKLNNKQYKLINALQAPFLALVLAFVIRYTEDYNGKYNFYQNENIPPYLFICIIVCLFMGMTMSAGEIIKDRKLLRREKFLHLSRSSYLNSKISLLFLMSLFQTIIFVVIANRILEVKGMNFNYILILYSVSCFANLLGLIVSSTFTSTVVVYIMIPVLLIPQMVLSGAIFKFDRLNKYISSQDKVPFIADLMVSRWAFEGLVVTQFKDNKAQKPFFEVEKRESVAYYKSNFWCEYLKNSSYEIKLLLLKKPDGYETKVKHLVKLLRNELEHEKLIHITNLQLDKIAAGDLLVLKDLSKSLEKLQLRYINNYSVASVQKDMMLSNYLNSVDRIKKYESIKNEYSNNAVNNLVKNRNSLFKIQQVDDRLVQKIDPIYNNEELYSKWYQMRAHFFASQKNFFGLTIDTFWFNIMVIWTINIISFILLYVDALRRMVNKLLNLKFPIK